MCPELVTARQMQLFWCGVSKKEGEKNKQRFMHLSLWNDEATVLPLEQSFCSATLDAVTAAASPFSLVTSLGLAAA